MTDLIERLRQGLRDDDGLLRTVHKHLAAEVEDRIAELEAEVERLTKQLDKIDAGSKAVFEQAKKITDSVGAALVLETRGAVLGWENAPADTLADKINSWINGAGGR